MLGSRARTIENQVANQTENEIGTGGEQNGSSSWLLVGNNGKENNMEIMIFSGIHRDC